MPRIRPINDISRQILAHDAGFAALVSGGCVLDRSPSAILGGQVGVGVHEITTDSLRPNLLCTYAERDLI
jgi:hypothetical protein